VNNIRTLICGALFCASGWVHGAIPPSAPGQEFTAKIIAVLDGDTVLVRRENGLVKIRLAEIDAPEKAQTFGETSKHSLTGMVLGKQVKVISQAVDQYGRLVAHLSVDGWDVNAEQIRRGMAWEYSNFHSNQTLIALQNESRQASRGLWAQSNPTPPWEWRKQHPSSGTARLAPTPDPGCGNKKHCSEMSSCEEAKYYLTQCGVKSLDGNGDGVPCEKLCAPVQRN
jgi:endonuclease YncB( thermonuclease family)